VSTHAVRLQPKSRNVSSGSSWACLLSVAELMQMQAQLLSSAFKYQHQFLNEAHSHA
jgi:hypothetical protein